MPRTAPTRTIATIMAIVASVMYIPVGGCSWTGCGEAVEAGLAAMLKTVSELDGQ